MPENTTRSQQERDQDSGKGAVEQDSPGQKTNVSRTGEEGHRDQDPPLKSSDSDYPEPGQNEEHSGEPRGKNALDSDTAGCSGKAGQDSSPGFVQKENQNKSKDDPLAD